MSTETMTPEEGNADLATLKSEVERLKAERSTLIFDAYLRGANWIKENGLESWPYLIKAARDYEDKTTSAARAALKQD